MVRDLRGKDVVPVWLQILQLWFYPPWLPAIMEGFCSASSGTFQHHTGYFVINSKQPSKSLDWHKPSWCLRLQDFLKDGRWMKWPVRKPGWGADLGLNSIFCFFTEGLRAIFLNFLCVSFFLLVCKIGLITVSHLCVCCEDSRRRCVWSAFSVLAP